MACQGFSGYHPQQKEEQPNENSALLGSNHHHNDNYYIPQTHGESTMAKCCVIYGICLSICIAIGFFGFFYHHYQQQQQQQQSQPSLSEVIYSEPADAAGNLYIAFVSTVNDSSSFKLHINHIPCQQTIVAPDIFVLNGFLPFDFEMPISTKTISEKEYLSDEFNNTTLPMHSRILLVWNAPHAFQSLLSATKHPQILHELKDMNRIVF